MMDAVSTAPPGPHAARAAEGTLRRSWRALRLRHLGLAVAAGVALGGILVLAAIFRWAFVELTGRLRRGPDGIRIKVLYRR